jgi:hypothetical protein
MHWRRRVFIALFVAAACVSPATADPPVDAVSAYVQGRYADAVLICAEAEDADALAFAARAALAQAVTADAADIDALTSRAMTFAQRALTLNPSHVEARLQLAAALGVKGRRASIAEAVMRGYARTGKDLIDQALALDPDNAWAHALLGGWNFEVVRRGGPTGAAMYGASVEKGEAAFDAARRLAPSDPIIAYQHAVALLEQGGEERVAKADLILAAAQGMRPRDAFERAIQGKASTVRKVLARHGPEAAVRLATSNLS